MHSTPGPPDGTDPGRQFLELFKGLAKAAANFLAFAPLFLYFFVYWNLKTKSRQLLHVGALSFLSLSILLLAFEVGLEIVGKDLLVSLIHRYPGAEFLLIAGFALSIFIVLGHHQRERRQARIEHSLAETIWLFLEERGPRGENEFVEFSLQLIKNSFDRHKAKHASLWQQCGQEILILPGFVQPPVTGGYLTRLESGQGVAGLVLADQVVRYVPRMFLPFNYGFLRRISWRFPHAVKFDIVRASKGYLDIRWAKVNVDAVRFPRDLSERFRSFVAVPLRTANGACIGVLCIDFDKTDPLGRADIKMASAFGLMMAEELQRIRAVSGSVREAQT